MDTITPCNTTYIYQGSPVSIYKMCANNNQACLFSVFKCSTTLRTIFVKNCKCLHFPYFYFFRTAEVCTHITGMLFLLSEYIASGDEFPEEKSCTDRKCWWVEQRCKLNINALNQFYLIATRYFIMDQCVL